MAGADTEAWLQSEGWAPRTGKGFSQLVGPLWTRREADGWAYGLLASDAHANPAGLVHGGLIATLLDHALSTIAWDAMARQPCVTVQLDTHYLAAARPGQFLAVRGRVMRKTSSLVFMQGELQADGEIIASAQAMLKRTGSPG
ncbi:phenylacetic acid degradation protein [Bordetella genomosp. 7]|uniref:Phenylacetic acid degradation protein n=1 Tax=Bordetella genomosp. 7 TaxID=1416805 RepID=A0A261QUB2_9BORD|nr:MULTISPECIES: PaaI family thioesterase [Bordetella]OZI16375.1 phenylacetic acid degradation protein [Bordetella genomosp. 7]OZI16904.1 phenylacetic acid degradation protein [Bordetella genomosp. 7]